MLEEIKENFNIDEQEDILEPIEQKKSSNAKKKLNNDNNDNNDNNGVTLKEGLLSVLPLKNVVMLPKSIIPIIVGRESSIKAVEFALKNNKDIFITTQKDANIENPTPTDIFMFGTKSNILQVMRMPNGSLKILAEGLERSRIEEIQPLQDFMSAICKEVPTSGLEKNVEIEAFWRTLKKIYLEYTKFNTKAPADIISESNELSDIDTMVDTIAVHVNLSFDQRQQILETANLLERIEIVCKLIAKEVEILKVEQKIKGQVHTQIEKGQKEYYLTEQIKAIQKELGKEDLQSELGHLQDQAKHAGLSKEAQEKVEKEIRRLEQMPPMSSEAVVSRHYIDWLLTLPWNKESKDKISLEEAENILNGTHAGLKKAKERIIEFLAAKKFNKNMKKSPIICLVGPPGVGKTSLGKSIADSLGREFARISLGGVRDEAEIRGHRRTYIGALPGKILQAIKKTGTINPVILLDEIDKLSSDIHGDPASALLEVLDPEQNKSFMDHFLEVEYDLSKVMFITTANTLDGIPYPLFDRMEIITLSGYTDNEKMEIARKFLIPRNLKDYGLTETQFQLPDNVLQKLIFDYTKEAGVRQLEREIAKLMRKSIQLILKDKSTKSIVVTENKLIEWLGNPKFKKTSINQSEEKIGLVTGLAWTELGGDVLEIETCILPGKGVTHLTGQLGDIMQESAQAALSYIRSRAPELGLKTSFTATKDIHIHIPEGATPKDGPSAGITICTALVSALTKMPVLNNLAMTGEITLRGRVLEIGGLKEKLIAAQQHGMKKVLIPKDNIHDLEEITKEIDLKDMKVIPVENMDEVIAESFAKNPLDKINQSGKKPSRKKPSRKKISRKKISVKKASVKKATKTKKK
ncbi:MAG: Lon protease [candidate division TM6 bacterium GW2011_GWF2_32_72]|nr:MAG: Lon protease [candidate division TM6 bacterium GW2011_GWF2_32_72]